MFLWFFMFYKIFLHSYLLGGTAGVVVMVAAHDYLVFSFSFPANRIDFFSLFEG
jgi:hypothetical protein